MQDDFTMPASSETAAITTV